MNIPTGINPQMTPGIGMPLKDLPNQGAKAAGGGASFDEVYNIGLNSLKSSVSEPSKTFGVGDFVEKVNLKTQEAAAIRSDALSGGSSTLHQAMIASQEASVSFSLLVEMRNKLLESYQELMRMQI
ncbi:MAG: flagellar hook-basal body complex protein FliE [Opitutales bacterium]